MRLRSPEILDDRSNQAARFFGGDAAAAKRFFSGRGKAPARKADASSAQRARVRYEKHIGDLSRAEKASRDLVGRAQEKDLRGLLKKHPPKPPGPVDLVMQSQPPSKVKPAVGVPVPPEAFDP